MASLWSCEYCDKSFSRNYNVVRHMRDIHKVEHVQLKNCKIRCGVNECDELFTTLKHHRQHVKEHHGVEIIVKNLTFSTKDGFKAWLREEEKSTKSKFFAREGPKKLKCGKISQKLICHRSGTYKPEGTGKRQIKSQGSNKIGYYCTASIDITEENDGKITVIYYSTHHGHDFLLGRLNLTKEDRDGIAGRLAQGISSSRVLKDVRSSETDISRKLLTSRKDLHNISQVYGITTNGAMQLSSNDVVSVEAWVESQNQSPENCVLFHKKQGEPHSNIDCKEFVLIIMTKLQREMLKKFGIDRVCIDSTHGVTGYDFELTTVLVIDEYQEGFPVAFCISSTVNTQIMKQFFNEMKNLVGSISCTYFMSDDTSIFINAWKDVMGTHGRRLLCTWHVDRAWQGKLNVITDKEKKQQVYKVLKTCMYELDKEKFQKMFDEFLEQLSDDPDTYKFFQYLKEYYANRVEVWAYAYRCGAKINTNMSLENFHCKLKTIYMDGKKSKRVDKCINALLAFIDDKQYDTLAKLHKGKCCSKARNLVSRHRKGASIVNNCKKMSACSWLVPSETKAEVQYLITRQMCHDCTDSGCRIICKECGICLDYLNCQCHDNQILGNACKHVHAVKMKINESEPQKSYSFQSAASIEADTENCFLTNPLSIPQSETVDHRKLLIETTQEVLGAFHCVPHIDETLVPDYMRHLQALKKLIGINLSTESDRDFKMKDENIKEPHNKKMAKQKRYISAKKERGKKPCLAKPSAAETRDLENVLTNKQMLVINMANDHTYL